VHPVLVEGRKLIPESEEIPLTQLPSSAAQSVEMKNRLRGSDDKIAHIRFFIVLLGILLLCSQYAAAAALS